MASGQQPTLCASPSRSVLCCVRGQLAAAAPLALVVVQDSNPFIIVAASSHNDVHLIARNIRSSWLARCVCVSECDPAAPGQNRLVRHVRVSLSASPQNHRSDCTIYALRLGWMSACRTYGHAFSRPEPGAA